MTTREALAAAAKWGGRLVVLLALGFLAWSVRQHWSALASWRPTVGTGVLIAAMSVVYGAAMMLIAESWHQILSGVSGARLSRRVTWPSFGVTQVAKYLPGNVFHYVGRHMWLRRQGLAHSTVLTATSWEVVLMASSALGTASIVLMLAPIELGGFPASVVAPAAAAILATLLLVLLAVMILRRRIGRLAAFTPTQPALLRSPATLAVFFLIQGGVFCLLFSAVGQTPPVGAIAVAGLSWLVGYVTPGAPGGLGSREVVMVALAAPIVGPADALILSAIFRVVTTLGDAVCFGISTFVARTASPGVESA